MVGLGDAADVLRVGTDVEVRADRGEAADEVVDRAAVRSRARAERVPAAARVGGEIVRAGDSAQVREAAACVERPVAVCRKRIHRAAEVAVLEHRRACDPGREVAGEQVIGRGDAGAVCERAADVQRRADDLERVDVRRHERPGRRAHRPPLDPVPLGNEVEVRVAAGIREHAAHIDLARAIRDRVDVAVQRRRAECRPFPAVPFRDVVRVRVAAGVCERTTCVEHPSRVGIERVDRPVQRRSPRLDHFPGCPSHPVRGSQRPPSRVQRVRRSKARERLFAVSGAHGLRSSRGAAPYSVPPTRGFRRADARIRTVDPFITSEVLYQLSYVGGPGQCIGLHQGRQLGISRL